MKKKRQPDTAREISATPNLTKLEAFEGFEKFRQEMIEEMIKTYELHHTEEEPLLKIPIAEMHSLLTRVFRETAKFYAKHSNTEFTQWFFQQYYQALGIPFDSNTAKLARDNVLHLAKQLYAIYHGG